MVKVFIGLDCIYVVVFYGYLIVVVFNELVKVGEFVF